MESHPAESLEPKVTGLRRNPLGWIVLAALFLLLVRGAVGRSYGRAVGTDPQIKNVERTLESSVALGESLGPQAADGARKNLADARATLNAGTRDQAFLRALIDRELGRKPAEADVKVLRSGQPDPVTGFVVEEKPKIAEVGKSSFSARLARAQARERTGTPRKEARAGLVRSDYLPRFGLLIVGLLGAAALGVGLWLWYGLGRANGSYAPKGLPSLPMTPVEADRFALRGAMMFGAFLVGTLAIGQLNLPTNAALLAQAALLGGIATYSLLLPRDRRVPHLSARGFGLRRGELRGPIAWGIAGAFANIPILLVVTVVSNLVLKGVPPPSHPSTEALTNNPALGTIALTFFLAAVCAPIWEEVFFRGLVFQGLVGARMAPVLSALLSSFLFASIHPQGIALWPALSGVALMACALLAQTRSIVACIAMHATHNALTVTAALVAGPIVGALPAGWVR